MSKPRIPRLIMDFKSKEKMEEFIKTTFHDLKIIEADYLHINPMQYNVDVYAVKSIKISENNVIN